MMDFTVTVLSLKEILFEKKNYREVLMHAFLLEKLSRESKKDVKDIVLAVLRHHNCLQFECLDLLPYGKKSDEILLGMSALAALRYVKRFSDAEILEGYQTAAKRLRLLSDPEKETQILIQASKTPFHIPDEVKEAPYLYNSLSLEFPEFLLKRLSKDYSPKEAISIALSLHSKPHDFYGLDERRHDVDDYVTSDNLTLISLPDKTPLFKAEKPLSTSELKHDGLYPLGYLEAQAFAKVELPVVTPKILLTNASEAFDFVYFGLKTRDDYGAEVIPVYEKPDRFRYANDEKNFLELNQVKPLLSKMELVKTYLSYDEYDLVVCFGADTGVGLARRRPDILAYLEEKDISAKAKEGLFRLEESSEFVKKGGKMIYLSHALDKEEGKKLLHHFLTLDKRFSLVEDNYVLPYEMDSDGGYYAILERNHD